MYTFLSADINQAITQVIEHWVDSGVPPEYCNVAKILVDRASRILQKEQENR